MTTEQLIEARRAAGAARWAGVSKRARSRQMKAIRAKGGGMPRSRGPRCMCGKYTLRSALQRGFDCCKRAGVRVYVGNAKRPRAIDIGLALADPEKRAWLLHAFAKAVESYE